MTDPLISVVIPIYNHRQYVGDCLDSIYHDDYPLVEVVAIDDGSTDGSWEAANAWRAAHPGRFASFRLLRQENQGVCKTLNRTIGLSRGELIALLASDDYLLPGGLRLRCDALRRCPNWLAVFCDSIAVDGDGRRLADSAMTFLFKANKTALGHPQFIAPELILRWSAPGPGLMLRREAFDDSIGVGLYDESLRWVEDRDFYLRLLAKNALGFVDAAAAAYRISAAGTSRSPTARTAVRRDLYISNAKRIGEFSGLSRAALRLVSLYFLTADRYHAGGGMIAALTYAAVRSALNGAYLLHTARVHACLSYGGRHARAESVRGSGELERVARHSPVPCQPAAERSSQFSGGRM